MNMSIVSVLENSDEFLSDGNSFGFYDWFCNTSSLERRAKSLLNKFKKIKDSKKINKETMYIWFKNNCPCVGKLYDDFRISDLVSGDVIFTVTPSSGHESNYGEAELWGRENEFKGPIVSGTYQDVVNWFNS
jgi:hypothetical protein